MPKSLTRRELFTLIGRIGRAYALPAPVVFGSWARGEQHEGSDIDIVVDLRGGSPWNLYGFSEEVYERTGLTPDVYDISEVRNSKLWPSIEREGVTLDG